ncbi:hypothetical protein F4804DRAFT_334290 [Jackrogersella minutella]|nr:hypothetical protein F4804DRAFT_334290 [Jackrogersella minutella]
MNQRLCKQCRGIFNLENLRKLSGQLYKHGQTQTIVENARNGCPFCGLMCHVKLCDVIGFPDDSEFFECNPQDWVFVHVHSITGGSLIDYIEIEVEGENQRGHCRAFAATGILAIVLIPIEILG